MAFDPQLIGERWGFQPRPGRVLVAGSRVYPNSTDRRALYAGEVIGVDMLAGEGVDLVHNLEQPLAGQFAHIDCHSVLEHCANPFAVARNLSDALVSGGTLLLSVPFAWRPHAYPNDYFRFTVEGVMQVFPDIDWKLLLYSYDGKFDLRYRLGKAEKTAGEKRIPKAEVVGWGVKR